MNIVIHTPTIEEEARAQEFILDTLPQNLPTGSTAWREAQQITGQGDYTPADEGMHWSDNEVGERYLTANEVAPREI